MQQNIKTVKYLMFHCLQYRNNFLFVNRSEMERPFVSLLLIGDELYLANHLLVNQPKRVKRTLHLRCI